MTNEEIYRMAVVTLLTLIAFVVLLALAGCHKPAAPLGDVLTLEVQGRSITLKINGKPIETCIADNNGNCMGKP